MGSKTAVKWFKEPREHDYPAAESYLSLILDREAAKAVAKRMQHTELSTYAAKDIFRASGLSLLGVRNSHVEKDRKAIIRRKNLSPLLLY